MKEQLVVRKDMDLNEHERLSNITLKTQISKKGYGCKWTWETIQLYISTQISNKEYGYKWTYDTIQLYTWTHIKVNIWHHPTLHMDTN